MRQDLFDLTGKCAVVIGGTSGLGRAIALGLAEAGADTVASARRPEEVEATAAAIEALGRRTLRVPADVRDRASIEKLHKIVTERFGPRGHSRQRRWNDDARSHLGMRGGGLAGDS